MSNKNYNKSTGTSKSPKRERKAPDWGWVADTFSENKKAERRAAVRDGTWKKKHQKKVKAGY